MSGGDGACLAAPYCARSPTMVHEVCDEVWWLPREVPVGDTLICRLGPLALTIGHTPGEWQLAVSHGDEADHAGTAELAADPGTIDAADDYERFIVAGTDARLRLLPLLADRPVVIRPRQSVYLPEGEEITLYMSTPVSVAVQVGMAERQLREVVSVPLSDTWFGPNTREGELCYSGRTTARQHRRELPRRAHRAITPVRIRNEAATPLPLTKLSLPVPVLSLFGAADGSLWTEAVALVRQNASDMAALEIDEGAPEFAGPVDLVSGPRQARSAGTLVRAFSVLFGT